ncbi:MAG: hypothetical protein RLY70_3885 [Planctomycetota bacterium]
MHLGAPATGISLIGLRTRRAQRLSSWFQQPTRKLAPLSVYTWKPAPCLRKSCGDSRTMRLHRWRPTGNPGGPFYFDFNDPVRVHGDFAPQGCHGVVTGGYRLCGASDVDRVPTGCNTGERRICRRSRIDTVVWRRIDPGTALGAA